MGLLNSINSLAVDICSVPLWRKWGKVKYWFRYSAIFWTNNTIIILFLKLFLLYQTFWKPSIRFLLTHYFDCCLVYYVLSWIRLGNFHKMAFLVICEQTRHPLRKPIHSAWNRIHSAYNVSGTSTSSRCFNPPSVHTISQIF